MRRFITFAAVALLLSSCKGSTSLSDTLPDIYPDYIGVTVPAGIAPMDFNIPEEYDRVFVRVTGSNGGLLKTRGRWASFPVRKWHALTEQNAGGTLTFTVLGKKGGRWTQWHDFIMYVSSQPLDDYGVTYRKIAPGYTTYSHIGLYQRDLHGFREDPIIESTLTPGQCMNCHTANATDPRQFLFHLRGKHGATMIQQDGRREWVTTKTDSTLGNMAYCYWHPEGRWLAGSINPVKQCFWAGDRQPIEVFDMASDLVIMDMNDHSLIVDPRLNTKDFLESSPSFTPDGKTLYYCKAKAYDVPRQVDSIRYDLMRVSFDPETGTIGNDVELVIDAASMSKSVCFPKPSYDGRYLMYTLCDYGTFSIWHHESDLWLLDIQTGETRPIDEVNSDDTDSYHNWSSNSRWFVFSSRRDDGLFTRPYIAHFDENGVAGKPFMLPQRDPANYYEDLFRSFNVPEFVTGPVKMNKIRAQKAINAPERVQFGFRWSK